MAFLLLSLVTCSVWAEQAGTRQDSNQNLIGQRNLLVAKVKDLDEGARLIAAVQADIAAEDQSIKRLELESKQAKDKLERLQAFDRDNIGMIPVDQLRAAEERNRQASIAFKEVKDQRAASDAGLATLNKDAVAQYAEFRRLQNAYESTVDGLVEGRVQARLAALQISKTVEVSGQAVCGDDTIIACKEKSKKAAEAKALDGSVVLFNSQTNIKNSQLSSEELHSETQAIIADEQILSQNWVGESTFETKIRARLEPSLTKSVRDHMADTARADIYLLAGGKVDYALVKIPVPATGTTDYLTATGAPSGGYWRDVEAKQREEENRRVEESLEAEAARHRAEKNIEVRKQVRPLHTEVFYPTF